MLRTKKKCLRINKKYNTLRYVRLRNEGIMKNSMELNKQFFISSVKDIKDICKPLFENFPIHYFDYFRTYKDGSRIFLCSSLAWAEYFLNQCYGNSKNFTFEVPSGLTYFSWEQIKNLLIKTDKMLFENKLKDAYSNFNIANGIVITENHGDYVDYYNFATSPDKDNIQEFYSENTDILKRFILYFREKANDLIKISSEHKFVPCEIEDVNHSEKYGYKENKFEAQRKIFSEKTEINRFYLSDYQTYLTKREVICLKLLSKNLLVKQIADQLSLSQRSVEFYIRNIKLKLNLHRQSELIAFVNNCHLFEVV